MYKANKVTVKRGPMESTMVVVGPWETKVLELVHGKDKITVGDEVKTNEVVNPDQEYGRLMTKYGSNKETSVPFVETIYGVDTDKLTAAIKKATVKKPAAKKVVAPIKEEEIK